MLQVHLLVAIRQVAGWRTNRSARTSSARWGISLISDIVPHENSKTPVIKRSAVAAPRIWFAPLAVRHRHLIENFFCKLKDFKRTAMRAGKTDESLKLPVDFVKPWFAISQLIIAYPQEEDSIRGYRRPFRFTGTMKNFNGHEVYQVIIAALALSGFRCNYKSFNL
ncbi:hypothetical protein [Rhizobium terrae]|uniref:hypothetical protein n=1 Tax=Rhizobium terrae TaxID=2171756 RepID=UPI001967FBE1|nr:hypothetical protein [Rhizobium terrae]